MNARRQFSVWGGLAALLVAAIAGVCVPARAADGSVIAGYEYTARPGAPGLGELRIDLHDAATGEPLDYGGNRLAAWLQRSPKTFGDSEPGCVDKVRALASAGIGRRAAVDFNTYGLVTVNRDRTVTFINPFLRLSNAKLEAVLTLPGDATAQLHHRGAHELWIAMRDVDAIAVIDTDTHEVKRQIDFAAGSRPQALALAGDAVWVAFAGRRNWVRFDSSASPAPDLGVSVPETTQLIASPDGHHLLGLHATGVVTLETDVGVPQAIELGAAPTAAAWSPLSQRWLVASADARLRWISPIADAPPSDIRLGATADRLLVFEGGRYALASMPGGSLLAVVDLASPRLIQTMSVTPEADEISLSDGFAYVHSSTRGAASLVSLADAREGRGRPVHLAIGAPSVIGAAGRQISSPLGVLARLPDGTGMLVASAQDGQIYQYAEGMMAPIGSFSNYRRSALALLVLNHGLEALGAGRYRAVVRHTAGGPHELVISGVQPRFAECLQLALPIVPDAKREALAALPRAQLLHAAVNAEGFGLDIDVRLADVARDQPVTAVSDLVLLAFDKLNGWQRRARFAEVRPGLYRATLDAVPPAGRIELLVSSATRDLPFSAGRVGAWESKAP